MSRNFTPNYTLLFILFTYQIHVLLHTNITYLDILDATMAVFILLIIRNQFCLIEKKSNLFIQQYCSKNDYLGTEFKQEKEQSEIADPHQDLFCVMFVQIGVVYFVWNLCTGVLRN